MSVHILNATRPEVESMLYATVYQQMNSDEQDIMNKFLFASQDLYVGRYGEEVACLWGLVPPTLLSSKAYLWLYCTPLIDEHKFTFIRQSQLAVEKMLERYDSIIGHTVIGNDRAIKWLKWLGATFSEHNDKVVSFVIRKKHG